MSKFGVRLVIFLCASTLGVDIALAVFNASIHNWSWFALNVLAAFFASVALFYLRRAIRTRAEGERIRAGSATNTQSQ